MGKRRHRLDLNKNITIVNKLQKLPNVIDMAIKSNSKNYTLQEFTKLKEERNYNIAKLSQLTNVNRSIIERYLDGKHINHIAYEKIVSCFPEIYRADKNIKELELTTISLKGSITTNGVVRPLYMSEPKEIIFVNHMKKIFGKNFIALISEHTNNHIVCKITDLKFNVAINNKNEFFVITDQGCYYGMLLNVNGKWRLCNFFDYKVIDINPNEKIMEVYQTFIKLNNKWENFLDKKVKTKLVKD